MHKSLLLFCAVLGLSLGLLAGPASAESTSPFTATAVQTLPNGATQTGLIYVSGSDTRFEFSEHGRDVIQIILPQKKIMRILFPKDKVFMEVTAPDDSPMAASNASSPCPPIDVMTCRKLGVDKFGEFEVERWSQSIKGLEGQSTLWWEPQRRMIVRQEYPDGRILQLQMTEKITVSGRETERWTIALAQPGKQVAAGYRLIDTDLRIVVKEQSPNGMIRELRNLKALKANPEWFVIPEGFQRIEPPKPTDIPK